jgi:hypothetical protein
MSAQTGAYDVFISYAREDTKWVKENLYNRLEMCRTSDGKRPRIFFDVGDTGIRVAQNWMDSIVRAIQTCRKFVAVYSEYYLRKEMCLYELENAHVRDPRGRLGIFTPILIDPMAARLIPLSVQLIQYCSTSSPNWFDEVLEGLELQEVRERPRLRFLEPVADITVNHTLPPVRIELSGVPGEEEVTVSLEGGELQGTLAVTTGNHVAVFADLSVGTAVATTRLVARVQGAEQPAFSNPFAVLAPPSIPVSLPSGLTGTPTPKAGAAGGWSPPRPPLIKARGEAAFFASGAALLLIEPDQVSVYDTEARSLLDAPVRLTAALRLLRCDGPRVALADWAGNIHLFHDDGRHEAWPGSAFPGVGTGNQGGFSVPGDVALAETHTHVGFWNGVVCRLEPGGQAVPEFRHEEGVQALAARGDHLYVCGFDGRLADYNQRHVPVRAVRFARLEPTVHLLRCHGESLVAVGDHRAYQIQLADFSVLPDDVALTGGAATFAEVGLPVVIDSRGKGGRLTPGLEWKQRFITAAGAVPVSADRAGSLCVFRNPDDSRTLMVGDRIRLTHVGGTLAVSPAGDLCAVGDGEGIALVPLDDLMNRENR